MSKYCCSVKTKAGKITLHVKIPLDGNKNIIVIPGTQDWLKNGVEINNGQVYFDGFPLNIGQKIFRVSTTLDCTQEISVNEECPHEQQIIGQNAMSEE